MSVLQASRFRSGHRGEEGSFGLLEVRSLRMGRQGTVENHGHDKQDGDSQRLPEVTVNPDNLVSTTEIAERAGVSAITVHKWRTRHDDFPQPLVTLAVGPVWYWPTVQSWLRKTGRA
jgi:hypothetical protein